MLKIHERIIPQNSTWYFLGSLPSSLFSSLPIPSPPSHSITIQLSYKKYLGVVLVV